MENANWEFQWSPLKNPMEVSMKNLVFQQNPRYNSFTAAILLQYNKPTL